MNEENDEVKVEKVGGDTLFNKLFIATSHAPQDAVIILLGSLSSGLDLPVEFPSFIISLLFIDDASAVVVAEADATTDDIPLPALIVESTPPRSPNRLKTNPVNGK